MQWLVTVSAVVLPLLRFFFLSFFSQVPPSPHETPTLKRCAVLVPVLGFGPISNFSLRWELGSVQSVWIKQLWWEKYIIGVELQQQRIKSLLWHGSLLQMYSLDSNFGMVIPCCYFLRFENIQRFAPQTPTGKPGDFHPLDGDSHAPAGPRTLRSSSVPSVLYSPAWLRPCNWSYPVACQPNPKAQSVATKGGICQQKRHLPRGRLHLHISLDRMPFPLPCCSAGLLTASIHLGCRAHMREEVGCMWDRTEYDLFLFPPLFLGDYSLIKMKKKKWATIFFFSAQE